MVSSSNITSSQASTISSMRSSSDSQPTFKPEFAKYIENKTNPACSKETGEPLKPEDDILYQWRLRRKMEEVKAEEAKNRGFTSLPIISANPAIKKNESASTIKQRETKEIETQTVRVADTAIQTSLDSMISTSTSSSLTDKLNPHKNEIPTRDEENKISNQANKFKKTKITKLVASSPIKSSQNKNKKISNQNINLTTNTNNNSIDLTKVSSINDMTYISNTNQQPPLKRSCSPVNILNKKSEIKQQFKSSKNHPITTLSSIESTITNVTSHFPQNTLTSSVGSFNNNIQNQINEINNQKFNKTVNINDSFNTNKSLDRLNKNITSQSDLFFEEDETDNYTNKYDLLICNDALREYEQDKEYYESDEILQILFKKICFYKSKLK
jgi:hypothetical protein